MAWSSHLYSEEEFVPVVLPPGTGLRLLFYGLISTEGTGACRDLSGIAVPERSLLGDLVLLT